MSLSWLWIEKRRRRIKRSISGSSSSSSSRSNSPSLCVSKWTRIRSPSLEPKKRGPPESLRFVYRTYASNGVKLELVTIPSKEFEFFGQADVKWYTRHDHCNRDSTKFRDITSIYPPVVLGHNHLTPFSSISRAGTNIYSLFSVLGKPLEFWSYSLDSLHPQGRQLAPPISQNRFLAATFSLFGKVYLCRGLIPNSNLGSQPFGEVYNPDTNTWSTILCPPNSDLLISTDHVFVASLGESNGKFMVYDYHMSANGRVYLYDVATQDWITHNLVPPKDFKPKFAYTKPVINKDDNLLYWIDERRGFMYALDWEIMNIYSGPVVGLEHSRVLSNLKNIYHAISLNHLWDEYFCLVWSTRSNTNSHVTEHHYTFLKVVKNSAKDSLVAFVIGCFVDLQCGSPRILDAICF